MLGILVGVFLYTRALGTEELTGCWRAGAGSERLSRMRRFLMLGAVTAASHMTAGVIVNISSRAAQGPSRKNGPYGASKAALDMVTRTAAMELAGTGEAKLAWSQGASDAFSAQAAGSLAQLRIALADGGGSAR